MLAPGRGSDESGIGPDVRESAAHIMPSFLRVGARPIGTELHLDRAPPSFVRNRRASSGGFGSATMPDDSFCARRSSARRRRMDLLVAPPAATIGGSRFRARHRLLLRAFVKGQVSDGDRRDKGDQECTQGHSPAELQSHVTCGSAGLVRASVEPRQPVLIICARDHSRPFSG